VTILVVCPDEQRLNRLKDAIHSAGFRTISVNALDAAWTRTDFFDSGAVVIDYELTDDIAKTAMLRQLDSLFRMHIVVAYVPHCRVCFHHSLDDNDFCPNYTGSENTTQGVHYFSFFIRCQSERYKSTRCSQ